MSVSEGKQSASMIIDKPYVLAEIKKITPLVTSFSFKAHDGTGIDFVPGMFAMLKYKNGVTQENIARAFSMANMPSSESLEFLISLIHGRLTSKLETAKVGDVYYISAPYGQFKFDTESNNKLLFLAGGTGIAPFLSMLRFLEKNGTKADCVMIYSVKYGNEVICKEELEKMQKDMGIRLSVTVTRPTEGDGWTGETGHINADMIKKYAPDFSERVCYICGPPAFVTALKGDLQSLNVDSKQIKAEMWG